MELTIFVGIVWIFSVCLHEFGHAVVAYAGGDTTVKEKGYLTLNILKYTDPGMTLFIPLFALMMGGIALPGAAVYIDHSRLRSRLWESAVSLAGPFMTCVVMVLLSLPFSQHITLPVSAHVKHWLMPGLAFLVLLHAFVTILNLTPIPPLDGYGVIEPWLPRKVRDKMRAFARYSIWLVLVVLWVKSPIRDFLWDMTVLITLQLGVPLQKVQSGSDIFFANKYVMVVAIIAILILVGRSSNKKQPSELDWYRLAGELQAEKKYQEAIMAYDKAIVQKPDFAFAWNNRGLACAMLADYNQAIGSFSHAIELNPDNADFYYNKACCYALQGLTDPALQNLERAIKLNPTVLMEHARNDSGFASLQNDPRFKKLVGVE